MPQDEVVLDASAYPYSHEILVEVTCRDADEDLVVYSYPFAPGENGTARPVEAVPDRHSEVVREALAEKDFEPDADIADASS